MSVMTNTEKDYLFACIIRHPSLFMTAKEHLQPEHIDTLTEPTYQILWQATLIASRTVRSDEPPERLKAAIDLEARKIFESGVGVYPIEVHDDLFAKKTGLIDSIFEWSLTELIESYGIAFLQKYLTERTLHVPIRQYIHGVAQGEQGDLNRMLTEVKDRQAKVDSIAKSPAVNLFPDKPDHEHPVIVTTGIGYMNTFMDGGCAAEEVYVLLGPTGSGKTTLAVKLAVEGAREQQKREFELKLGPAGHWYYFSYESPIKKDIRYRIWANAGRIAEKSLKTDQLSSCYEGDYKDYEKELFSQQFAGAKDGKSIIVPGERERFLRIKSELRPPQWAHRPLESQTNLHLVDFSGAEGPAGSGHIQELVSFLERERASGRTPFGIIIDYASVCVNRYISSHRMRSEDGWTLLSSFVDDVRNYICNPLKCCAWVVQQLHGDTAALAPTATLHHSKALGCRNFADNAVFSFSIGNKTSDSVVRISCTKQRRAEEYPPMPLLLQGKIRDIIHADEYSILPSVGRIVRKDMVDRVAKPANVGGQLRANYKRHDMSDTN